MAAAKDTVPPLAAEKVAAEEVPANASGDALDDLAIGKTNAEEHEGEEDSTECKDGGLCLPGKEVGDSLDDGHVGSKDGHDHDQEDAAAAAAHLQDGCTRRTSARV